MTGRLGHCTGTFGGHSPACDRDGTYCALVSTHDGRCVPHGAMTSKPVNYPPLSPAPIIEWGPGSAKVGKSRSSDVWQPADAALQVEEFDAGESATIGSLAVYTVDAFDREKIANASIELTREDCERLGAELQRIARGEAPATVERSIEQAKAEIQRDVANGRLPATVGSFAELHDYVDANEYGGLTEEVYRQRGADADFGNAVQDALDEWIKGGALRGL